MLWPGAPPDSLALVARLPCVRRLHTPARASVASARALGG